MNNMQAWLFLALTVALILLNGYFVAQEFAFVAVRRARVEALVLEGDKSAKRVERVLSRLSFMLSGAQFGITVTSLVTGFIANDALGALLTPLFMYFSLPQELASGISLTLAFAIVTMVQMVFGELAPKNWAIAEPERLSRAIAPSTLLYLKIAYPIITFFDESANALLRLIGIQPVEELNAGSSAEELEYIVSSSTDSGELDENLSTLFNRAIGFGELDAGQVCVGTKRLVSLRETDSLRRLHELVVASGHSRYPVLDPVTGRPRGIADVKSILHVPREDWSKTYIRDVLQPIPMVPDSLPLAIVLNVLRRNKSHAAFVIDEHGNLEGMVTLEDLLEELVGDIRDEHDADETPPHRVISSSTLEDGRETSVYEFRGWARVDELERATNIEFPEGDYNTVAGLFVTKAGKLGSRGDTVTLEHLPIEHTLKTATVEFVVTKASEFTTDILTVTVTEDVMAA